MKATNSAKYLKFIAELSQIRKSSGVTQVALAHILGKPQSYVSKFESGERRLDVIEFVDICKALNINPNEILDLLS